VHVLVPALKPRDVMIMDNLNGRKGDAVWQMIRKAGAHLLFLPAYFPDLNPIEQVFAKLKTLLRKAEERTIENLWKRAGQLLTNFQPNECQNYLQNAGCASL
jgi:transposase